MKAFLVILVATASLVGAFAVAASADAARVSLGEAEAVYNAIAGRGAIILHSPMLQGAPDTQLVRIGPFGAANGRHFCSRDWHVLGVNLGDSGSYGDVSAWLDQLQVTITLDGTPFLFPAAPVKRALPVADLPEVWFRAFGGLLAPDALDVGTHTTRIVVMDPSTGETDAGSATFFIDAQGTGACA